MADMAISKSAVALGRTFTFSRTVTTDGAVLKEPSLAAAKTGTLSTRTDDDEGTLTLQSGHGVTTGAKLDIYWEGGSRAFVTVGTVSGTSVPFTLGSGDNLPAQGTAVTAMVPQEEPFAAPYADMEALVVGAQGYACTARFVDGSDAAVATVRVYDGVEQYIWFEGTNPFGTTDVAAVYLSHGRSSAAQKVMALAMVN